MSKECISETDHYFKKIYSYVRNEEKFWKQYEKESSDVSPQPYGSEK